jgi:dienelactone hydrolase
MRRVFGTIVLTLLAFAGPAPVPAGAAIMTVVPATPSTPPIPVYIARPTGTGPFPAVLLLHSCQGFDGLLAIAADRLAAGGYVGVALDALGPHGMQTACNGNSDAGETGDARATLAWLRTQSYVAADRLAILGFSMGGDAALNIIDTHGVAAPAGLRVAVVYYASCEDRDGLVSVPLAIFDGDADKITPAPPCAAMVRAGTAAGKALTITTYPGATHGFNVPGPDRTFFGEPMRYDQAAALDAAAQTLRLLVRYLGP